MDVNELNRAFDKLRELDQEIQLQTAMCFLFVAQRGVCTQRDVERELGLTNAGASRNISYWTDRRFDRRPGMGFIARTEDEHDRRFKTLRLTSKGQSFYDYLRGKNGKTSWKQVDRRRNADGKSGQKAV